MIILTFKSVVRSALMTGTALAAFHAAGCSQPPYDPIPRRDAGIVDATRQMDSQADAAKCVNPAPSCRTMSVDPANLAVKDAAVCGPFGAKQYKCYGTNATLSKNPDGSYLYTFGFLDSSLQGVPAGTAVYDFYVTILGVYYNYMSTTEIPNKKVVLMDEAGEFIAMHVDTDRHTEDCFTFVLTKLEKGPEGNFATIGVFDRDGNPVQDKGSPLTLRLGEGQLGSFYPDGGKPYWMYFDRVSTYGNDERAIIIFPKDVAVLEDGKNLVVNEKEAAGFAVAVNVRFTNQLASFTIRVPNPAEYALCE